MNKDWNLVAKEFDIAGDCYEFEVPFSETPGGGTLGIGGCKPHQGCMDSDDCETSSACAMAACTDCQCKTVLMFGCCSSDDACDDGNPCTTDSCTNNKCSNSPKTNCCQSDSECDDGETCTKATNQCFKVAGGLPGMPGG